MKLLDSFLEAAGNLGFLVGNNDRVRERKRKASRSWGLEREGFAVSAAASGANDSLRIEVALRNTSDEPKQIEVSGWLHFFPLIIEAQLTRFGERQIEAAQSVPKRVTTLQPEQVIEADIPISALYNFNPSSRYTITATCRATSAISNVLEIRI